MAATAQSAIAVIGIDIGKNSFHVVGLDGHGAIVLRQKWSRGQVEARFANMSPCLIGMEACVGAHHLSRKLKALGHDARLMPARYVRPYSKGTKRLEHGVFLWPPSVEPGETLSLTSAQLSSLIDGVDWRAPEQRWRPAIAG